MMAEKAKVSVLNDQFECFSNKAKLVPKKVQLEFVIFFEAATGISNQPGAVMATGHCNVIILHQAVVT